MKKLLITGASGFLGGRAAAMLADRFEISAPRHGEMDITDRDGVRRFFEAVRPDLVLHCAAMSDVGQCAREPERSQRINVDGSVNVAAAAHESGAKCLLCSSDQVYAGTGGIAAHREDEDVTPAPLYGKEKLTAERECLAVNPDCVMMRLTWMYDVQTVVPGEKSDFFRGLLARMTSGERLRFSVHDRRGLTYVGDVVENFVPAFSIPGGVYNFGSPNIPAAGGPIGRTMAETAQAAFAIAGLDPDRIACDGESYRDSPRNLCMDAAKLNAVGIRFPETAERIGELLKAAGGMLP